MKLFIKYLFILILFAYPISLKCKPNISNDSLKSKKVYSILDRSKTYEGRLYIFTNYNSCNSCINELSTFIDLLNEPPKLEIVIFMSGLSNSALAEIKRKNDWNFEIVPDPLGLYFNEYHIAVNNSYVYLDNGGILLKYGDIYDIIKNPSILKKIKIQNEKSNNMFQLKKEIIFVIDTNQVIENRYVHGLYSKLLDNYFIYHSKSNSLNIYDSTGLLIQSLNIPNFILYHKLSCISMSWISHDTNILLHLAGVNMTNKQYTNLFIEYDIKSHGFSQINLSNLDSLSTPVFVNANPINQGFVSVSNFRQFMKNKNLAKIKPLTLFDKDLIIRSETGCVSQKYFDFELRNAYLELITFSNSNLFSLQAYSKILQKIDLKGNILDTINIEFPSSFKNINSGIPINPTTKDWVNFIRSSSILRNLSYDLNENNFLTIFRNDDIPDGIEDPFSPLSNRNYYLNIFDFKGKLISNDFRLSEDFPTIIYYKDNEIGIMHTSSNKLQVNWYEFNTPN